MVHEVRGVVARSSGAPVQTETILVPDPGPGEALIQVQACGVCHTDLHYREGAINDDFPFLLGHEAAGIVEAVGPDVTSVAPGDFVVLNWRAVCGECRSCRRGKPWYCFATHNATQKMTLADGTELTPALGIGAFAEKTLVAAGQATKVNPAASWTARDTFSYMEKHGLPTHPLFDKGYASIGCAPCTRPVLPGESERDGRWAGQGKTECGLHTFLDDEPPK